MTTLIVFGLAATAVLGLVIILRMTGISVWQFLRDVYWPFGGADYFEVMESIRRDTASSSRTTSVQVRPQRMASAMSAAPAAPARAGVMPQSAPPAPARAGGMPQPTPAIPARAEATPQPTAVGATHLPSRHVAPSLSTVDSPAPSPPTSMVMPPSHTLKRVEPQSVEPDHHLPAPLLDDDAILSVAQRRHTAIVGITGDGKTTCSYTLLVRDLADGCQCVVVSRHFSPYHEEDQRIDLRPIAHLFEAYRTPSEIAAALERVATIIDTRLDDYYANRPIGHPLVVYLGEWRSLRRMVGQQRANEILEKILDEGRKVKVWAVVELHSALIAYIGSDSGTRAAFGTCLVGNVDPTSWKTLMGTVAQYPVPLGYWATERGMIRIIPPSSSVIADLARRPAPSWTRLVPSTEPSVDASPPSSDDCPEPSGTSNGATPPAGAERAALHPDVLRVLANVETVEQLSRLLLLANGGQRTKVRRLVRGDNVALGEMLNRLVEELGL